MQYRARRVPVRPVPDRDVGGWLVAVGDDVGIGPGVAHDGGDAASPLDRGVAGLGVDRHGVHGADVNLGVGAVDDEVIDAVHVDGRVRPRDGERRQVVLDPDGLVDLVDPVGVGVGGDEGGGRTEMG